MSKLRRRLEEELKLRGYSEVTVRIYVRAVRKFAEFHGRSPADLGKEEIRAYLLYLMTDKQASRSGIDQAIYALKFFYTQVPRGIGSGIGSTRIVPSRQAGEVSRLPSRLAERTDQVEVARLGKRGTSWPFLCRKEPASGFDVNTATPGEIRYPGRLRGMVESFASDLRATLARGMPSGTP
jgi:hypothetical protein